MSHNDLDHGSDDILIATLIIVNAAGLKLLALDKLPRYKQSFKGPPSHSRVYPRPWAAGSRIGIHTWSLSRRKSRGNFSLVRSLCGFADRSFVRWRADLFDGIRSNHADFPRYLSTQAQI